MGADSATTEIRAAVTSLETAGDYIGEALSADGMLTGIVLRVVRDYVADALTRCRRLANELEENDRTFVD